MPSEAMYGHVPQGNKASEDGILIHINFYSDSNMCKGFTKPELYLRYAVKLHKITNFWQDYKKELY